MHYDINLKDIDSYNTHTNKLSKASVLLVIEMQEAFRSEMSSISDKQINNVNKLIHFAEANDMPIIFVRHNDSSKTSQNMINWWGGDKLELGSKPWKIIPEIDTKDHKIIDKSQYSAFYETDLDAFLKSKQIKDIIICGLMTNCCCETAARDAFMRGYNVFFINDAAATINAELHLSSIKNIAFGFGRVLNTENLLMDN